jgi:hypothetical protein
MTDDDTRRDAITVAAFPAATVHALLDEAHAALDAFAARAADTRRDESDNSKQILKLLRGRELDALKGQSGALAEHLSEAIRGANERIEAAREGRRDFDAVLGLVERHINVRDRDPR